MKCTLWGHAPPPGIYITSLRLNLVVLAASYHNMPLYIYMYLVLRKKMIFHNPGPLAHIIVIRALIAHIFSPPTQLMCTCIMITREGGREGGRE